MRNARGASPLAGPRVWGPVAFFLVFTLFPVYWLVNSSLKAPGERSPFRRVTGRGADACELPRRGPTTRLGALYVNSLCVATLTCLALIVLIVFAGYAMARFRFRGKTRLIVLFLLARCCRTSCC